MEKPLSKCDCEECDCDNATPDGVCFECQRGLHARDREGKIIREQTGHLVCRDCGQYPCDCARDL